MDNEKHVFLARHGDNMLEGVLSQAGYEQMKNTAHFIKTVLGQRSIDARDYRMVHAPSIRARESIEEIARCLGIQKENVTHVYHQMNPQWSLKEMNDIVDRSEEQIVIVVGSMDMLEAYSHYLLKMLWQKPTERFQFGNGDCLHLDINRKVYQRYINSTPSL